MTVTTILAATQSDLESRLRRALSLLEDRDEAYSSWGDDCDNPLKLGPGVLLDERDPTLRYTAWFVFAGEVEVKTTDQTVSLTGPAALVCNTSALEQVEITSAIAQVLCIEANEDPAKLLQ